MRITVKLLIESEAVSERAETTVAAFDRDELTAASLGLSLAEAKALLKGVQRSVVDAQVKDHVLRASHCLHCNAALTRKDPHRIVYRTPVGRLSLSNPRLYKCNCSSVQHHSPVGAANADDHHA